ncbi:fused PTS fructose transporter subunit IIA/HPr protein [Otariodibacter sp.]|uniref:fused PTS fructose transporter subunit IIA/HPr protein n=1 Tax=Otariodibacter sp. TaxID=3030919 RepID=UPI00260F2796|nr:fused PTS fructose transporter subunit IIA/HPr protein [Otariodibacter sp.]
MLSLSADNILLNQYAKNKQEAIHLIAHQLVQHGNVEFGYESGMINRENQISTFLGNGIAVPHGTLETRHLVKKTGIQIMQFPEGVEWEAGNIAYVVIGIAAKSDEHLTILQQLTSILNDECITQKLAKVNDIDEFIALFNGSKVLPIIDADLISFNENTTSLITLSAMNAEKLAEKGYVDTQFIQSVITAQPLKITDNLFIVDSEEGNQANGIAVVKGKENKILITFSHIDQSLKPQWEKLLNKEVYKQLFTFEKKSQFVKFFTEKLVSQAVSSKKKIVNPHSVEKTFTIHNQYGLHIRNSTILVNLIKGYDVKVKAQNIDTKSPLVSTESLMNILSLGVQKGQHLRFVAIGKDAQVVLEEIGKAIDSGLGEE